jgi:hypothetical protein
MSLEGLEEINQMLQNLKNTKTSPVQEQDIFVKLTKTLEGVTAPEIEYVLGSENIVAVEQQMMRKFNEFLFATYRYEFAKKHPDICKEYVEMAISNKENYHKLNANKVQEQQAQYAELEAKYKALLQEKITQESKS